MVMLNTTRSTVDEFCVLDMTMRVAVFGAHLDASSVTINFSLWSVPETGINSFCPYPRGCR